MALHVRGVLLPDDEVRDLWLVGDRVTLEPVAGAETVSDGGYVVPGLVDAHCHLGIQYGARPIESLDEARELAHTDRDTGVLALRDAGSPYPYPELDDEPGIPRLVRAGQHVAPVRRYLRDIGIEVDAPDVVATVTAQAKAGTGWVKLVGDWIDRSVGDLAPSWDPATMAAAVEAAHAAGVRAAVHTFSEEGVAQMVRAGVDSVEHGTGLSLDLIDEMARRGTALVPTMINIRSFGGIADQARAKFPGYADHMLGEEFAVGLSELLTLAWGLRTAVMCAELLWWRCHRRIIADVLVALGYEVRHIQDAGATALHELAPPARVVDGVLTYTSPVVQLDLYSPHHGFLV